MARAKKIPKGRAYKRIIYSRRYAPHILAQDPKKRKSPNWHAGKKELIEAGAATGAAAGGAPAGKK